MYGIPTVCVFMLKYHDEGIFQLLIFKGFKMECVCTQCGSDNIQRLEVIYEHGTQDVNTRSKTMGVGVGSGLGLGGAKTETSGTSQSKMAQKSAPPTKKKMMIGVIMIFLGIALTVLRLFIFGVPLAALGGFLIYKAVLYNKNQFPALYETWLHAWMCNKCGTIFVLE